LRHPESGSWDEYIKPRPLFVNISVFDDSRPPKALKDVAVWLHLNDVDEKKTGDFGRVRFEIPPSIARTASPLSSSLTGTRGFQGLNQTRSFSRNPKRVAFSFLPETLRRRRHPHRHQYQLSTKLRPIAPGDALVADLTNSATGTPYAMIPSQQLGR